MKVLIIDVSNLGWMAFGQAPLTYENKRVEAVFIGMNMVRSLLDRFEPDRCIMALDGGLDPERKALYPEYKRKKKELTPIEKEERRIFREQLRTLQDLLHNFGLEFYQCDNCEADDVIFSLIDYYHYYKSPPLDTKYIIVSTDKDFYQLYSYWDDVEIYNPVKKEIITREYIEKQFGISVEWYLEFKAMIGDSSDNLPGVKGLGPKKASWLVNNIIIGDLISDIITESEQKTIAMLSDNIEIYNKMRKLMKLKHIGIEKLESGLSHKIFENTAELDTSMLNWMTKYGFDSRIQDFMAYTKPFIHLWRREK